MVPKDIIFKASGIVERGKKHAGGMGFPTVNIPCPNDTPLGIFAGEMDWKGILYPAAIYRDAHRNVAEAHVLDFSQDLYGETITLIAREKVRDVKTFKSKKGLIAAIRKDIEDVRKTVSA